MQIMRIRKWLAGIASAVVMLLMVALPVLAYTYVGTAVVTVTESAGTTYTNLPIVMTVNNSYMATNGFMQSNGLDAAIAGTGGIALPTMIDSTQTLFVAPVTKSTQNGFNFTTGNTPVASMPIIVGTGGYLTTADSAALEIGSNGSFSYNAYLDTTAGASKHIIYKSGAIDVFPDTVTNGKINADINATESETIADSGTSGMSGVVCGQTFTPANSGLLIDAKLYNNGFYSDPNNQIALYATTGGNPTGSPLALSDVLGGWNTGWGTFIFSTPYQVVSGTKYAILFIDTAGATWEYTNSNPYTGGNGGSATINGSKVITGWTPQASNDYWMKTDIQPYVSITGVSSGVYTITPSLSGGTFTLTATPPSPATPITSSVAFAGSVPNNANAWVFNQNNVSPYINYITETVGGTEVLKYQPNTIISGTTLPDRDTADGAQDATITFGSNPAGIAVAIGPLTTVSSGSSVSGGTSGSSSYAPPSSGSQTNAEQLPALNAITFPLEPVVHGFATIVTAANPSNEPATELMMVRICAGIVVVGGAIGSLFLIRGHLFIAGVAGLILMGIWIAWHVYPLASISIAVVFLIGTVLADRGGSD